MKNLASLLQQFTPLYIQVLKELAEAGAQWVQIDEPILTSELSIEEFQAVEQTYAAISMGCTTIKDYCANVF